MKFWNIFRHPKKLPVSKFVVNPTIELGIHGFDDLGIPKAKGGRNDGPSQVKERPDGPQAIVPMPSFDQFVILNVNVGDIYSPGDNWNNFIVTKANFGHIHTINTKGQTHEYTLAEWKARWSDAVPISRNKRVIVTVEND